MYTKQELLLGRQAVALKLLTKEQLKECFDIQEQSQRPLALILKQKGINDHSLERLALGYFAKIRQENSDIRGEDLALCRLIFTKALVSAETLFQIFTIAQKAQADIFFAELVIQKRLIPIATFFELYDQVPNETFACSGCQKEFRLMNLTPGKKLRCKHCKNVFYVPSIEEEIGQHIGHVQGTLSSKEDIFAGYEILEEIAQGGMGIIYRVQKKSTGQIMALKVLREAFRNSEEAKQRFSREAKTLSKLKHPNIVSVLDVGIEKEIPYFTMDFIEGQPLSDYTEKKKLSLSQIVDIVIQICDGLQYAHKEGIIHRDIKPSNILLEKGVTPRITDFGLAKCMESVTMVTRSGTMLGTPYYMAPEQARGQLGLVGPRSDLYSLGVVFYELLTNHNPFRGENTVEIYHNILTLDPSPPSSYNKEISKKIDIICLKCLKKDSFQRYKTARDLADDLRRYRDGKNGWWQKLFG